MSVNTTVSDIDGRDSAARLVADRFASAAETTGTEVAPGKLDLRRRKVVEVLRHLGCAFDGAVPGPEDRIVEAGVWRGLSARLMAEFIAGRAPDWTGHGLHLVDSFEGLSPPRAQDLVETDQGQVFAQRHDRFSSSADLVRSFFDEFPDIEIHEGWIPPVLTQLPAERCYRFVHLDTDLFEPTYASLLFFVPRMRPGGVIVEDDYSSQYFPGVRRAWSAVTERFGLELQLLETGQCCWTAPGRQGAEESPAC